MNKSATQSPEDKMMRGDRLMRSQSSKRIAQEAQAFAESIVDTVREPLLVLDEDLRVVKASRSFCRAFQVSSEETTGTLIYELGNGQWDIPALRLLLEEIVPAHTQFEDFEVRHVFPTIGLKVMLLNARKLYRPGNNVTMLLLAIEDVTDRRTSENSLVQAQSQDRRIALALQRPMLFHPNEDAFSGLLVQTAYAMASDEALVGGDFWDTFAFSRRHIALVIGDVMGHGLSSAVFTTELKHTLRAYIREHGQPGRILQHMNDFLYESNRLFDEGINTEGSDSPVCLALAIVERDTGAGTLAIAGMEPPIVVRADGRTEQSTAVGTPLGIIAREDYRQVDFQLEAGDTLILSTDGIAEARQGRKFLDIEGVMDLAAKANGGTLKEMADAILNGAFAFAGGKLRDDASIVLVRRALNVV